MRNADIAMAFSILLIILIIIFSIIKSTNLDADECVVYDGYEQSIHCPIKFNNNHVWLQEYHKSLVDGKIDTYKVGNPVLKINSFRGDTTFVPNPFFKKEKVSTCPKCPDSPCSKVLSVEQKCKTVEFDGKTIEICKDIETETIIIK